MLTHGHFSSAASRWDGGGGGGGGGLNELRKASATNTTGPFFVSLLNLALDWRRGRLATNS